MLLRFRSLSRPLVTSISLTARYGYHHPPIIQTSQVISSYSSLILTSRVNHGYQHLLTQSNANQLVVIRGGKTHLKKSKPGKRANRIVKTKKSAAKRFIITGKGKLKYKRAGKSHLNAHKSRVRINRLNVMGILKGRLAKNMRKLLT
mmetsp:Transcript_392/g.401  ORF Transcript_392/g.401 Transcript_392/m.401 type:complete len:147 (-) Transcript_392:107-547(-)